MKCANCRTRGDMTLLLNVPLCSSCYDNVIKEAVTIDINRQLKRLMSDMVRDVRQRPLRLVKERR